MYPKVKATLLLQVAQLMQQNFVEKFQSYS